MAFHVRTEQREAGEHDGTIVILEGDGGNPHVEVWPARGLNAYQWRIERNGQQLDLLYTDPQLFPNGRPTRSGIPILFPFPNRIRAGRFSWQGRDYQLPLNDSTGRNPIHGFVCRRPWRIVAQGGGENEAWLTAEFHAQRDAPETRSLWPADYLLTITYRLRAASLTIEARVENPDRVPLPFGLGYHPYFRIPLIAGADAAACWIQASARTEWELQESLPTGVRRPVGPL